MKTFTNSTVRYHNHIKTLSIMINHTNEIKLMKNIREAYNSIKSDERSIPDIEERELVNSVKQFANDIFEKALRTPKQARYYFEKSDIPDRIKTLVWENDISFSKEILHEHVVEYAKMKYIEDINKAVENINITTDKLNKSGISNIDKRMRDLTKSVINLSKLEREISLSTSKSDTFVINPNDTPEHPSFGVENVEQNITEQNHNIVSTGMWIDNLVGGGFRAECLYVIAALPQSFKSGFMLNVAEYVSCHHDIDDFLIPDGMIPVILYINLEMSEKQVNERRCSFYGEDPNDILYVPEEDDGKGRSLLDRMVWMLNKHGSKIPIVTQNGEEGMPIIDIETKISECERSGYKVIMLITDYLDLFDINWNKFRENTREEILTIKAIEQRALARKLKIPVLTGAQLNRESEEITKMQYKAATEDIVKYMSSRSLAKAHALKQKVEILWLCHRFSVEDMVDNKKVMRTFLGLVCDKDRDNVCKYIPSPVIKPKRPNSDIYINKKTDKSRTYYVCELNGMRMSETIYSDAIRDLTNVDNTAIDIMSTETDIDELEKMEKEKSNK